ncbi:MAG: NlpC/P60 family protein [Roseobacter sp.]|jgi:cell wall-associated NlpC family hydrolase|nr:NlpC/P60 family protein [Roseobacter sp.]
MTDPRSTPDPALVTLSEPASIRVPLVDLKRAVNGPRDRQLLYGDAVTILGRTDDHALIRSEKDGYCGMVTASALGPGRVPTHRVTARATHAYAEASFKSPDQAVLSFGSSLFALSETATFIETELGFVPRQHVRPAEVVATDPAAIAALFEGSPYLWGGNGGMGLDCSGLVQAACLACGIPCPGDSDQQAKVLGTALAEDALLHRNDVIFWTGHVALVVDDNTLIHANAGHMTVSYAPIREAIARIDLQGDGLPTMRRRLLAG